MKRMTGVFIFLAPVSAIALIALIGLGTLFAGQHSMVEAATEPNYQVLFTGKLENKNVLEFVPKSNENQRCVYVSSVNQAGLACFPATK